MIPRRSILAAPLVLFACARADEAEFTVAAAASLTDVVEAALAEWNDDPSNTSGRAEFAASSTLARQIEHGARRDVFLSANREWLEHVSGTNEVTTLAANRLVLATTPVSSGRGLWTTGDPDHVPLGKYAKAWMQREGTWDELQTSLVRAKDARAALRLLERGEVDRAVLYASDAITSDRVRIVETVDDVTVEILGTAWTDRGRAFLAWLTSDAAAHHWRAHGLVPAVERRPLSR